jgi:hypothetical protein
MASIFWAWESASVACSRCKLSLSTLSQVASDLCEAQKFAVFRADCGMRRSNFADLGAGAAFPWRPEQSAIQAIGVGQGSGLACDLKSAQRRKYDGCRDQDDCDGSQEHASAFYGARRRMTSRYFGRVGIRVPLASSARNFRARSDKS